MAHITLAGVLYNSAGELAKGDQIRFTHNSTTGNTVEGSVKIITIPEDGSYSIDLQYGLVLVEYKDAKKGQFACRGVATVNQDNPATSIPELLNALVPVSSEELIEFQAILADCVAAKNSAEDAADRAEDAADRAEVAADSAILNSEIYPDTAAGISATSDGDYFSVVSASDDSYLDLYLNDSSTAVYQKTYPSIIAVNNIIEDIYDQEKTRNIFIDSLFKSHTASAGSWLGRLRATGWNGLEPTVRVGSEYEQIDGKSLQELSGSNGNGQFYIYTDEAGIIDGDSFTLSLALWGTTNKRIFGNVTFYNFSGATLQQNVTIGLDSFTLTGDNQTATTSLITPPTGTYSMRFNFAHQGGSTGVFAIDAVWGVKGTDIPENPLFNYSEPNPDSDEVLSLKEKNSLAPSVIAERWSYTSKATALEPDNVELGSTVSESFKGWGVDLITQAISFNAIELNLNWDKYNDKAPVKIKVAITTAATGEDPITSANATLVSYVEIDVDPTSGGESEFIVPCKNPSTGEFITISDSDLSDLYAITFQGVASDGSQAATFAPPLGLMPNAAQANGNYLAGTWVTYNQPIQFRHLLLSDIQSNHLNIKYAALGLTDKNHKECDLSKIPSVIYGVVGREVSIYFDNLILSTDEDIDFSVDVLPVSLGKLQKERWTLVPATAGDSTITITVSKSGLQIDSKTIDLKVADENSASGTVVVHNIGDSLTEQGSVLKAINDINDGVTAYSFIGTKALLAPYSTVRHDGYSGQTVEVITTSPTISGFGTNPFYSNGGFDYSYFISNGGHAAPDCVYIWFGPNDQTGMETDARAQKKAEQMAKYYQSMIDSIKSYSASVKVVLVASVPSGTEENGFQTVFDTRGASWRMNRNLKITAKVITDTFKGLEASGIYVLPAVCGVYTDTAYKVATLEPLHSSIKYSTYATYALLIADLSPDSETLAYATDVDAYFVKVGGSSLGYWRAATTDDNMIKRDSDGIHYSLIGGLQQGEVYHAATKNLT